MRNTILLTALSLSAIAIWTVSVSGSHYDQLACRMSRSPYFAVIMAAGKRMASRVKQLPDSTRERLQQYKLLADQFRKSGSSGLAHEKDSLLQVLKLITSADTLWFKETRTMVPVYQKFNSEFPEYKKLSREERSSVFKKAARLFMSNAKS